MRASSTRRAFEAIALLSCLGTAGCDSNHILLATGLDVRDIGQAVTRSFAVVSSDNNQIIYVRDGGPSDPSVVAKDVRSQSETVLFPVTADAELWTATYDSNTLLFTVGSQVVEYSLGGSVLKTYSQDPGSQDRFPSRSPDGQRLAFLRMTPSTQREVLMVRDATNQDSPVQSVWPYLHNEDIKAIRWVDTSHVLVSSLTTQGTPGLAENKVWDIHSGSGLAAPGLGTAATADPTGRYVVSFHPQDKSADVYLSRVDGTDMTRLTNSSVDQGRFNWSQDRHVIVYQVTQQTITRIQLMFLPPLR